jgi:hypothetical protein
MAKKAAKSKTKKASAGKKTSTKANKGYRVQLPSVLAFVEMLKKEGQLDQFLKDEEESGAALTMDAKCIAFVKKFVSDKGLPNPNQALAAPKGHAIAKGLAAASKVPVCPCFPAT